MKGLALLLLICGLPPQELTLLSAFQRALRANPTLNGKRVDPLIARAQVRVERAPFDPLIQLDLKRTNAKNPTATQLSGANVSITDTRIANLSVKKKMEDGTGLSLDFQNQRNETNSRFSFLNPNFNSVFSLNLDKPLLKNSGQRAQRTRLTIAFNGVAQAGYQLEKEVTDTVRAVERAYWELYFQEKDQVVKAFAVEGARKLRDYNKRRQEIGISSRVEVLEAEAVLAAREEERLLAQRTFQTAQEELKLLLALEDLDVILKTTEPVERRLDDLSRKQALEQAFDNRPEIKVASIDSKNKDLMVGYLKTQTKHDLDLLGSYAGNGLGKSLGLAHDDVFDFEFPTWSLGVTYKVPLDSNLAKGELRKGMMESRRAAVNLEAVRREIVKEVLMAWESVAADTRRVETAARAQDLSQEKLKTEEVRFQQGLLSNFDLLRFQEDLARARSRAVRAAVDLLQSTADLDRATGRLLARRGVTLAGDPGTNNRQDDRKGPCSKEP